MIDLSEKVAIITGAAGGFGQVLVHAFLDAGARVAALDVDEERLRQLSVAVGNVGANRFLSLRTDIADYAECERAVAQTRSTLGGLHILINNGALGMGVIRADRMTRLIDIEEITPAMWQRFVAVNFTGAWNMTRAAIAPLRRSAGAASSMSLRVCSRCCAAVSSRMGRARQAWKPWPLATRRSFQAAALRSTSSYPAVPPIRRW